jgi:hypothetical protein
MTIFCAYRCIFKHSLALFFGLTVLIYTFSTQCVNNSGHSVRAVSLEAQGIHGVVRADLRDAFPEPPSVRDRLLEGLRGRAALDLDGDNIRAGNVRGQVLVSVKGLDPAVDVEAGMAPGKNPLGLFRAKQLLADKIGQHLAGKDPGQTPTSSTPPSVTRKWRCT